ncbi:universal stress protein [Wenzhouxiangella sp. XN24]|uniref:universal stress protein n=1 Tax=Wenzhouxiangella sp. XN24 TaxID=2713569 RepID=UPI0013EA7937|nr:universal stress protein [Wenzhouxiangella sp. XN24]NGX17122.1 universal stress protein [Wenzhouxiangella sp. XN24]
MRIVAAVDRSDFADLVVGMVRRLAAAESTEVLLLNIAPREADVLGRQLSRKEVLDPVPEALRDRRELLDRLAGELQASGIRCSTLLLRGVPAKAIVQEASRWSADLIVVGSQGRGMLYRRVLGSVSEEVLAARRFPVLVVPRQVDA